MKAKTAIALVATLGITCLWFSQSGNAVANDAPTVATCVLTTSVAADGKDFEYVGTKKCKMCHRDEYKSWKETTHGKAFDVLKPGNATEAKTKHGLDAAKDYTTDAACLVCHTVGFGKKGGYAIPDASDAKAVKKMAKLAGVGCEDCHGPGKAYVKIKKVIKKEKRKYKFEELAVAGMNKIEASVCTKCHNDKSPTFDAAKGFDFDKAKEDKRAIHVHKKLELREE